MRETRPKRGSKLHQPALIGRVNAAAPSPGSTEGEDRTLGHRIAASDATALALVYDRHAPLVYGVLLRMLQSAAAAEELVQEVFWALWTHPERFDPERGGLRVFLFQLARSRALDHLRRERRRSELLRNSPTLFQDDGEHFVQSNPFLAAVSSEDRTRIRQALADLPQAQRRVLALSYFDGLSHSEIAEQLGEPLGTVKTRIRGGLARMRARLSGGDETEQTWHEV